MKYKHRGSQFFWLLASGFWLLCNGCGGAATATSHPGDIELSQQLSAARMSFTQGAWAQAVSLYGLAVKRAEAMDDPAEIANAAYNYAAALTQAGRYTDAREALREAKVEAARSGASAVDAVVLDARVARLAGELDDASSLADDVLADKSAGPENRLQAFLVKGQVACEQKDIGAAEEALRQARGLIGQGTSPVFAAGIEELGGCIALLKKDPLTAAQRFDHQAALLRQAHLYADMFRALARAGAAYAEARQPDLAADRYFRAARSALAQNDPAAAALLEAADHIASPAFKQRIVRLRRTLPTTRP